jgi:Rrf2 family protein
MLTKKSKYAIKALCYLAQIEPGTLTGAQEISDVEQIPKKFLDAILIDLKNSGLIFSKKGVGGGFSLAKTPTEITVGEVIRVTSGFLAPIQCASKTQYRPCDDCQDVEECNIRRVMQKARDALSEVYDNYTLERIVAVTKPDIRGNKSKNIR